MIVALFTQEINESVNEVVDSFLTSKFSKGKNFFIEKKLLNHVSNNNNLHLSSFNKSDELSSEIDLMVSIGGDGTFLRTIEYVRDLKIPVMGINTGNLGFLATTKKENLEQAIEKIYSRQFKVENRSLLKVSTNENVLPKSFFPFALNEVSVVRKDTTSMINIKTSLDGSDLNSYWADGLIVSTPTGSTGYSLSCGGPVISPKSSSLVLTPISPHNLNARPLVISDQTKIELIVSGREDNHLLSVDSKIFTVKNGTKICIEKPKFDFKIAHFSNDNFYRTLKEKLFWGKDKRN